MDEKSWAIVVSTTVHGISDRAGRFRGSAAGAATVGQAYLMEYEVWLRSFSLLSLACLGYSPVDSLEHRCELRNAVE
jgi:hypothetical protein